MWINQFKFYCRLHTSGMKRRASPCAQPSRWTLTKKNVTRLRTMKIRTTSKICRKIEIYIKTELAHINWVLSGEYYIMYASFLFVISFRTKYAHCTARLHCRKSFFFIQRQWDCETYLHVTYHNFFYKNNVRNWKWFWILSRKIVLLKEKERVQRIYSIFLCETFLCSTVYILKNN